MSSRRDLLSPRDYDDDAESLRSPASEQDSDSEDDKFLSRSRTTLELAEHDRTVLDDEEELEKLLTRSGPTHDIRRLFSPNRSNVRIGKKEEARRQRRKEKRDARRARREKRQDHDDEEMYEMEEGQPGDESSLLSDSSSNLDERIKKQYTDVQVCLLPICYLADLVGPAKSLLAQIDARFLRYLRPLSHPPSRSVQSLSRFPRIEFSKSFAV